MVVLIIWRRWRSEANMPLCRHRHQLLASSLRIDGRVSSVRHSVGLLMFIAADTVTPRGMVTLNKEQSAHFRAGSIRTGTR